MATFKIKCSESYEDIQLENFQKYLDTIELSTSVDNDGIGHYECWGFCGNDKGTDYILLEHDPIKIEISNREKDDRKNFLEYIMDEIENLELTKGDLEATYKLKILNEKDENNILSVELIWDEV